MLKLMKVTASYILECFPRHNETISEESQMYKNNVEKSPDWGQQNSVRLFIKNGADVNRRDRNGFVPLQLALDRWNLECVKLLIDQGANVNVIVNTPFNRTLLSWCILRKHPIECIKLLIDHGADVNAIVDGESELSKCIQSYSLCLNYMQLLVKNGADVNMRNENGFVPLQLAIDIRNIECVNLLIDQGADVNVIVNTPFNRTLLNWCISWEHPIECIQLLIDHGADVNAMTDGMSVLTRCIIFDNQHPEYSWILIKNGADVNVSTSWWGATVVDLAVHNKNTVLIRLLIRHGAKLTDMVKRYLHNERLQAQIKAENMMTTSPCLSENITKMNTSRANCLRFALSKACDEREMEVVLCLVMMGADPWSVDIKTMAKTKTKKGLFLSEPWDGYYVEEMDRVWRRRMFISLSVVKSFGDNLFKRLKDRNVDVWRISISYI